MCFGCSKEQSHQDGSFEHPQHMFWLRNNKNNFQICSLWRPVSHMSISILKTYMNSYLVGLAHILAWAFIYVPTVYASRGRWLPKQQVPKSHALAQLFFLLHFQVVQIGSYKTLWSFVENFWDSRKLRFAYWKPTFSLK